jgi:large subunit ribosomal protein L9
MEVILRADVPKLGHRGEVVKVAEGYARNYLLPKRLAVAATAGNKKVVEQEKSAAVRREATERGSAEELARQLNGVSLTIRRKAGDTNQLFGSVTSMDVAEALESRGFHIDRRKIHIDDPIKNIGEYEVPLRLHRDVTCNVKVEVVREE